MITSIEQVCLSYTTLQ